jgi:DNA-binding response OmpR family regulator
MRHDMAARPGRAAAIVEKRSTMVDAKLLIIEDDDAIAELFVMALREDGYAVERVTSPQEALDLFGARGPDAFDLVLSSPCANPYQAPYAWLDRLRAGTSAAIVICSSYPAALYSDHRMRGYAAFLPEPFDLQTLINLVTALVDGADEQSSVGS